VIICFAANPSIDKLFEVDRLVPGAIHRPLAFVQTAGGKGLNVARAAHALDADVIAAGILGGGAGRWIEGQLREEGIAGSFVWAGGETRASLSVASRDRGDLTEFYEHGDVVPTQVWTAALESASGLFEPGRWLTISGSLPQGAPEDGYLDLARRARAAGVRVALDAEGEQLRLAIAAGPDVVKVNAREAGDLLAMPTTTRDEALTAAERIREMAGGQGHAGIVTRGAEGAVVAGPDGTRYEGVLYERGRYPVGSGDAFLAGLVVTLDRDSDWPAALRLALGTATANAEVPGAGRLDPARARGLAERAGVREV